MLDYMNPLLLSPCLAWQNGTAVTGRRPEPVCAAQGGGTAWRPAGGAPCPPSASIGARRARRGRARMPSESARVRARACGNWRMRPAAASSSGPATSARRRRAAAPAAPPWPPRPSGAGGGAASALTSSAVNSSHSSERAKCGAWLCRRASVAASATRPCAPLAGYCRARRTGLGIGCPTLWCHICRTLIDPVKAPASATRPCARAIGHCHARGAMSVHTDPVRAPAFATRPCAPMAGDRRTRASMSVQLTGPVTVPAPQRSALRGRRRAGGRQLAPQAPAAPRPM